MSNNKEEPEQDFHMAVTRLAYESLRQLLALPPDHTICYIMNGPVQGTFELMIKGPMMPVVNDGPLPLVELVYQRGEDNKVSLVEVKNVQPNPE